MGRQAYLNRLALGRSPYEAPERRTDQTADLERPTQRRDSALQADDYVQHYDERGHPVNPESRTSGRELRRAKNDILSTMGIVVSEDGNVGGPSEQQKIDMIATENDYGLVMATVDQALVFLGSWWASSLTGRIQAFQNRTYPPLANIMKNERAVVGNLGFYFGGIPTWVLSTCLSICRHHPLERLVLFWQNHFQNDDIGSKLVRASLNIFHSATRGTLLVLAIQTYMYSLLQTLHLVPSFSIPGIQFLIPFGENACIPFPSLPTDLSLPSLSGYLLSLLKAPSVLLYVYLYLRPVIEIRLYRLIRRRLSKPSIADELSIKVAFENDLIDWMLPMLGRRSEEENRRTHMSFTEDLMYEMNFLRRWALSWFGFKSLRVSRASEKAADARRRREWLESLPLSIEQLQNERQSRTHQLQRQSAVPPPPEEVVQVHGAALSVNPGTPVSSQTPDVSGDFGSNRVLSNEENPISQSPAEMSTGGLSELTPMGRTSLMSPTGGLSTHVEDAEAPGEEDATESRRNSRSNTLFSSPSSPETSSPTSPRVRASLIHQNSDVITMQLELLGNRHAQIHGQINPRTAEELEHASINGIRGGRRSFSEILDNLLANQGQNANATVNLNAIDGDALSNLAHTVTAGAGDNTQNPAPQQPTLQEESPVLTSPTHEPVSTPANILPESVEEPGQEDGQHHHPEAEPENDFDSEIFPRISDPNVRPAPAASNAPSAAHRVTILSSQPVDSLASHLASMATSVLFIPLESLYLRSLASTYLAATGAPANLQSSVRGMELWGGGGSRYDILAYMSRLALMMGMQAAVNASFWGIISGAAIKIGRRFCGWGSL